MSHLSPLRGNRHRIGPSRCCACALLLGIGATVAAAAAAVWLALAATSATSAKSSAEPARPEVALIPGIGGEAESVAPSDRVFIRTSVSQLLPQLRRWKREERQQQRRLTTTTAVRYHPASFGLTSRVLNTTVFCDEPVHDAMNEFFAEPTWRCNNIRIDHRRLPFCESTPHALNEQAMNSHIGLGGWLHAPGFCGQLAERKTNLFLLCGLMLQEQLPAESQPSERQAMPWLASSVKIPHGNCSYPEMQRIILTGRHLEDAAWLTEKFCNPGFVTDLLCSFDVPTTQPATD